MILRPSVLDTKSVVKEVMSSEISRMVQFMEATFSKIGSNSEYSSTSVEMISAVLLLAPNAMAAETIASGHGGGEGYWTRGREGIGLLSELLSSVCANSGLELYLPSRDGGSKE